MGKLTCQISHIRTELQPSRSISSRPLPRHRSEDLEPSVPSAIIPPFTITSRTVATLPIASQGVGAPLTITALIPTSLAAMPAGDVSLLVSVADPFRPGDCVPVGTVPGLPVVEPGDPGPKFGVAGALSTVTAFDCEIVVASVVGAVTVASASGSDGALGAR